MLNKYVLTVQGNKVDIADLRTSIFQMNYNKVMHRPEFGKKYFFGMRRNWFPLILLGKYTINHGKKSAEERINIAILFMSMLETDSCHSFYLDDATENNTTSLKIYYRSKDNQKLAISRIMSVFNLKYRIDDVK